MSSSRVHTTFTGPVTCLAICTARTTKSTSSRRPNPPPSRWLCPRTLARGRPVSFAAAVWVNVGTCVPSHRSQPSGRTCTVQFTGSSVAWARNGSSYTASVFWAAPPLALTPSPPSRAPTPRFSDRSGRARHRLDRVAVVACHHARFQRRVSQRPHDVRGPDQGVRPLIPADVQRGEALFGRPHVIGHNGHRVVQPHDLAHARYCLGPGVVDAGELAAEHGAGGERGDFHIGKPHVDAELRRAVHLA